MHLFRNLSHMIANIAHGPIKLERILRIIFLQQELMFYPIQNENNLRIRNIELLRDVR